MQATATASATIFDYANHTGRADKTVPAAT
jgi:hypothetical protein